MDKELKKKLKAEHKCVHCQEYLPEGYDQESCRRCKKILKRASADAGWRWKLTLEILDHYGWICRCCGEREPMFLTLDHSAGGGNIDRSEIRKEKHDWYKQVIDLGFPDDLQILCYNCNLGKSRNGGICPHNEVEVN